MTALEFQSNIVDGKIEVPLDLRNQVQGPVNVILFSKGDDRDVSSWPSKNRRRWQLIAKKLRSELTDAETCELAELQQRADDALTSMGPRPVEELERWYAELTTEG